MHKLIGALLVAIAVAGCGGRRMSELEHPFYVGYIEDSNLTAIFICSDNGVSCAIDGLPGPAVFKVGIDENWITAAVHPETGFRVNLDKTEYFYVPRAPWERPGRGETRDTVVGPLTRREFDNAKRKLGLPELTRDVD